MRTGDLDLAAELREDAWPQDAGWHWLYRSFDRVAARGSRLRRSVCSYFWPRQAEQTGEGGIYRILGVAWFGRVIPTGGIGVRRLTGLVFNIYPIFHLRRTRARIVNLLAGSRARRATGRRSRSRAGVDR